MEKRSTLTLEIFDSEKGRRAAQRAILEEIYLVDAKTWRDPLVISPEALFLEHKCSTEILFPKEYEDRPLHFILCKFRVAAFNDKSPNKPVMKIEATFYTSFSLDELDPDVPLLDLGPELMGVGSESEKRSEDIYSFRAFNDYLYKVNPISSAWPYWREFVQSMSTRMGYPALTVPMLEIVLKKPEKKTKDGAAKKGSTRRKKLSA